MKQNFDFLLKRLIRAALQKLNQSRWKSLQNGPPRKNTLSFFRPVTFVATLFNADSKIQSSTDKCVFRYYQSKFWWPLPASDYCRARCNQIVEHSADNEAVLGSSRKLGGAAEHLIDGSEKRICLSTFEF